MKKAEPKEELIRIYLDYTESETGGDICEGQENDAWPNHEDSHKEVSFKGLTRDAPAYRFFYTSYEIVPELAKKNKLYMAVVYYYDGGTFGRTYGYWHFVGLYASNQEAKKELEYVLSDKNTGFKPWDGYFAGYTGKDVICLDVSD